MKPAKIIQKSENGQQNRSTKKDNKMVLDRNRNDLFYDKDDEISNDKLEYKISLDKERLKKENEELQKKDKKNQKSDTEKNAKESSSSKTKDKERKIEDKKIKNKDLDIKAENKLKVEQKSPKVKQKSPKADSSLNKKRQSTPIEIPIEAKKLKTEKPRQYKPFNKLLQGVTLVISGIQVILR